jgi:rhodanese-related sulfurtransferase
MTTSIVAPRRAWALLADGHAQLIDLRARDELDQPRIPGARPIPLDELAGELATLDPERPVVFLSSTGRRAADAAGVLREAGMTAFAIEGGIRAWLDAGLPAEHATIEG